MHALVELLGREEPVEAVDLVEVALRARRRVLERWEVDGLVVTSSTAAVRIAAGVHAYGALGGCWGEAGC